MNFKGLRIFIAIMEEGSLARASETCHVSQPAASRMLRLFEDAVGDSLFFRTSKTLTPTQEAELLYPEAVRVLSAIERMPGHLERMRAEALLPIRILCLPRIVDGLVLPAMARLKALVPQQRFALEIVSRREMGRRFAHGDYDIGVGSAPLPLGGPEPHQLTSARLKVMLHRDHPLAGQHILGPADMLQESYIALNEHTILRRVIERELAAQQLALDITHEVSSSAAAYRMVRDGMGFTFADPLSVPAELLTHVRLIDWEPTTSVEIVYFYPRSAQKHKNRDAFIEQLGAICQSS